MSNEILSELLSEYDKKKLKAELDLDARKAELYKKLPRLQEIEDELNNFAINTAKNILLHVPAHSACRGRAYRLHFAVYHLRYGRQ